MKKKRGLFILTLTILFTLCLTINSYALSIEERLYEQMKPTVYINNTLVEFDEENNQFIYSVSEDTENVVVTNIESTYTISPDTMIAIGNIFPKTIRLGMGDNIRHIWIYQFPDGGGYHFNYDLHIIRGVIDTGGSDRSSVPLINTTINPITNTVEVSISEAQLASLFAMLKGEPKEIKLAVINIPKVTGLDRYGIQLPTSAFTASNSTGIRLETNIGSLTLMDTMLQNTINAQNVKFNMEYVDKTALDQTVQDTIGDHPIIRLNMELDGKTTEWNNPDSPVIVSVPYTPTPEELANPELITVYYIDGLGNLNAIPNAVYDAENECMVFSTTHFSDYAIAYSNKTFTDITDEATLHAIEVLAAKGIVNGKTETIFAPKDTLTRAEFITILNRAFELNADFIQNFADVQDGKWYYESVGIAKELKIVNGIGNDRFDPNGLLTKKQVEVIVERTLNAKRITKDNLMALLSGVDDSDGVTRDEVCLLVYYLVR